MLRFVVHRHSKNESDHFDLMLEGPRKLRTWQISPPYSYLDKTMLSKALPDHRRIYLTYQGKISRDRGSVKIVEAGHYRILKKGRLYLVIEFRGRKFRGKYLLAVLPGINDKIWLIMRLPN
ncbi:MAG: DNA polymerase ligase N-terminal domain-containing protein [Candidatus Brocadiia bacterium]